MRASGHAGHPNCFSNPAEPLDALEASPKSRSGRHPLGAAIGAGSADVLQPSEQMLALIAVPWASFSIAPEVGCELLVDRAAGIELDDQDAETAGEIISEQYPRRLERHARM